MLRGVEGHGGEFAPDLQDEVEGLLLLVDPPPVTLRSSDLQKMEDCLGRISHPNSLLGLLSRFPVHGKVLVDAARARFEELQEAIKWEKSVQECIDCVKKWWLCPPLESGPAAAGDWHSPAPSELAPLLGDIMGSAQGRRAACRAGLPQHEDGGPALHHQARDGGLELSYGSPHRQWLSCS